MHTAKDAQPRGPASIDQLPAEILLAVFAAAALAHDDDRPCYDDPSVFRHVRRRRNPAVALSHVCTRWRALANATPSLWETLYLDGDIDGDRAEAKAMWWTRRLARATESPAAGHGYQYGHDAALPGAAASRSRPGEISSGVVSLVLTRIQDWTPDDFAGLCDALELLHLGSLRAVRYSWMGGGLSPDENRQLQAAFRFLVPSATTLRSLTVFSPSHLRIGLSLPRLGHTFSALESVEIRSCKLASPASDAYLLPAFLPRYAGESDWRPLTSLRHLVLVGPVWRLRYQDGTIASPVVSAADLPAVEYVHLGSTAPPVFWNLLSHSTGTLRHLTLEDHLDHPTLPDPDLALCGIANLRTLKLLRSAPLADRLLACALRAGPSLRFLHLETLELAGAHLQQGHLDLFATTRAPALRRLVLSDTTSPGSLQLQLPSMASLEDLVLTRVDWITAAAVIDSIETSRLPRLGRLAADFAFGDLDQWKLKYRGITWTVDAEEPA
ncbi:hypothetical protein JCM3774_002379 [Rhodotorula dairenensis]